jgi:predicted anti-sigma-YlaC factor YlaD
MNHRKYQEWISAYFDGELTPEQKTELEQHLQECPECRSEFEEVQRFESLMAKVSLPQPSKEVWTMYWTSVYNRLERKIGWLLLSLGSIILLFFGAYNLVEELIKDPHLPLLVKIGILSFLGGVVVLLVSFLRERLFLRKRERYKEVEQ